MADDGVIEEMWETTNGRKCAEHECCGKCVEANDIICFKKTITESEKHEGILEIAAMAVLIRDGKESCKIGVLPPRFWRQKPRKIFTQYAQIKEIYDLSENSGKRLKSRKLKGAASFSYVPKPAKMN